MSCRVTRVQLAISEGEEDLVVKKGARQLFVCTCKHTLDIQPVPIWNVT